VLDGFLGAIAVGFGGQEDKAHGSAVAAHRFIHAFGLNRERAVIVVGFTVDQEERDLDLIGCHKGRHLDIKIRVVPEGPALVLEAEGRQRAIRRSALGDSGFEEVGVREQAIGHIRAVTVAAYAHAVAVGDTHLDGLVDGGFGIHQQLLEEMVVDGGARTDDGHRSVVQDGVAIEREKDVGVAADLGEPHARAVAGGFTGDVGGFVFIRVGPQDGWKGLPGRVIGRQIERERHVHAIGALIGHQLLVDLAHDRLRIGEVRDRGRLAGGRAHIIVGRLGRTLAPRQEFFPMRIQQPVEGLVMSIVTLEELRGFLGGEVIAAEERMVSAE